MLGLSPLETVTYTGVVTLIFSTLGRFRGVILTDFILFFTAMVGSVIAAYVALDHPEVRGMGSLISHEAVVSKLSLVPSFDNTAVFIHLLFIPLAIQWRSSWYPGSEPGGGGYIAQRILASKSESML